MSDNVEPGLPRAHGSAVLKATIRSSPVDFLVEEINAFEASGSGEHLLLAIEKRGMNTAFVAGRIARWANIPVSGIGYAGLKDRHAVTQQRFSVHLPGRAMPDIAALEADAPGTDPAQRLRVLACNWHAKKIPRGALLGNRFVLVLRDLKGGHTLIDARLHAVLERGVPNYFGGQRFGHDGGNVAGALAMFAGKRVRREQRTHLLSAARSQLFNRVLAARVAAGNWDRPLDGEVWMLDGSRSLFGPEPWNETLAQRLHRLDIHPSAPLWGRGMSRATGSAALLEMAVLADHESMALRAGLEAAGLKQERRATRLCPQDLAWNWIEPAALELRFSLPPGTYATTVLAELGEIIDRAAGSAYHGD